MHNALKMLWFALGFNALVAVMNAGFAINHWFSGNLVSAGISLWFAGVNAVVAWFMWRKIREQRQKDKQRVADILSGKYNDMDTV